MSLIHPGLVQESLIKNTVVAEGLIGRKSGVLLLAPEVKPSTIGITQPDRISPEFSTAFSKAFQS